jgi:hypothetical protein
VLHVGATVLTLLWASPHSSLPFGLDTPRPRPFQLPLFSLLPQSLLTATALWTMSHRLAAGGVFRWLSLGCGGRLRDVDADDFSLRAPELGTQQCCLNPLLPRALLKQYVYKPAS